jgi:threonine dehydratase
VDAVSWEAIAAARERIGPWIHRTPVVTCSSIDRQSGATVFFKCENLQRTGSFKFRGATNAVLGLPDAARTRGVYTHSSGNHAQALARAAQAAAIPAFVVMPENATSNKLDATRGYGAEVDLCPPTQDGRVRVAAEIGKRTGATFVHPHDDPAVIAGQGTAVCELIEDVGPLDLVLVPVGGGGLLSGTAVALAAIAPGTEPVGCEPAGADDAYRSLASGARITDFTPHTVADGLRTPLGENTFAIIRRSVRRILRIEDPAILHAMRFFWERTKLIIEPSSAVAVAPLLGRDRPFAGQRIGVLLSGGNVDVSWLTERHEQEGR